MQSASLVRRPSLAPVLDCFQLAIKHWSQGSHGIEAIAKCMQVKRVMKPCVSIQIMLQIGLHCRCRHCKPQGYNNYLAKQHGKV